MYHISVRFYLPIRPFLGFVLAIGSTTPAKFGVVVSF